MHAAEEAYPCAAGGGVFEGTSQLRDGARCRGEGRGPAGAGHATGHGAAHRVKAEGSLWIAWDNVMVQWGHEPWCGGGMNHMVWWGHDPWCGDPWCGGGVTHGAWVMQ